MHFRIIHPTAGVIAEFGSAQAMIEYFVQLGRSAAPPETRGAGLLLQVSQGGLYFQEFIDTPADAARLSTDDVLFKASTRLMQ